MVDSEGRSGGARDRWFRWLVIVNIVIAAAAVGAVVLSIVTLVISLMRDEPLSPDEIANIREEIVRLIDTEAAAAREGNVEKAAILYAPDAEVRDGLGEMAKARGEIPPEVPTTWIGVDAIRERYASLPEFKELAHTDVDILMDPAGSSASAQASTSGVMVNEDGSTTAISSILGEKWMFERIDGEWKIASFTYNLK